MDGDIAPLPGIVEAAEADGAAVFVDDAHASGVLGRDGRGTVDHFGLHGRVAIQVGTLSKAVGALGGYVAGSPGPARHPDPAGPAVPVLDVPSAGRRRRLSRGASGSCRTSRSCLERLWANTRRFKAELTRLGFDTGRSETPITPVMMGDPETAMRFSDRLMGEGVFAQPVVFPTVAMDQARLRTIVTAAHADEQLDRALEAFATVGRELGVIRGMSARPGGPPMTMIDRQARDLPLDAHLHTDLSPDSDVPIDAYAAQAVERGIAELAITDHVDFEPGAPGYALHDVRAARAGRPRGGRALGRRAAWPSGSASRSPGTGRCEADIRDHLRRHAYDFVIGSVHVYRDSPYAADHVAGWVAGRSLAEIVAPYFDEVEAGARSGLFDALGHLDFVKRYLRRT